MKPVILETDYWKVELNSHDQTNLGRSFVTVKRDVGSMSNLTNEEWLDFAKVVKKLEAAAKQAFGAMMCNWTCLMNLAYQHDPPDPQVHWHFRPRYRHPVEFGGETFIDTSFGHHYERGTDRQVDDRLANKIAVAYQKEL